MEIWLWYISLEGEECSRKVYIDIIILSRGGGGGRRLKYILIKVLFDVVIDIFDINFTDCSIIWNNNAPNNGFETIQTSFLL